ncbi:MAG: hypothetical protein GVY10_08320 [Verrucomicrobia bacterium]|nr:hypothetical protein [Verrucomicrobiota bacterium]
MPENFKKIFCRQTGLADDRFVPFLLRRCLFNRFLILSPLLRVVRPNLLFHERRLLEQVGKACSLKEIQNEVDFYQHKYVVNSILKDALKFRLSGMKLMNLANRAYSRNAKAESRQQARPDEAGV